MRLQPRCQLGLQSSEGLAGAEGPLPRWLPHMGSELAGGLSSLP